MGMILSNVLKSFIEWLADMTLIGIYSSGISVSEDSKITSDDKILTTHEHKLLESIGTAHMEREIQNRVLRLTKQNRERLVEESGIQPSLTEEDMRSYLQQVITEIQKTQRHTNDHE